ncbi:MAG TPA: diadenylate cyclase CdaA [Ruminiclostridium sp.]|nr:diadenylate cyclase CdaA [Ruminiclostridium sp.]
MDLVNNFFQTILSVIKTISISDIIDILLVSFLLYKAIQLIRETRAEQLIKGIILFVAAYYFSMILGLKAMSFILINIFQFGVLALIVVFQPELRSALEHLGRSSVGRFRLLRFEDTKTEDNKIRREIYAVCEAAQWLQKDRIGALILFERKTRLGEIIKTGTVVNADVSSELICNIFYPKAPLHDGAMILRDGRVYAAGCFLPLSQNQDLSRELGTRHRAALGISESCDVLVVVVSEETGVISLVQKGIIKRNLNIDTLRVALEKGLLPEKLQDKKEKKPTSRGAVK